MRIHTDEDDHLSDLDEFSSSEFVGFGSLKRPGPAGILPAGPFHPSSRRVLGLDSDPSEHRSSTDPGQKFIKPGWILQMEDELQEIMVNTLLQDETIDVDILDPDENLDALADSIHYYLKEGQLTRLQRTFPGFAEPMEEAFRQADFDIHTDSLTAIQNKLEELKDSSLAGVETTWRSLKAVRIEQGSHVSGDAYKKLSRAEAAMLVPPEQNMKSFIMFYASVSRGGAGGAVIQSDEPAASPKQKPQQAPKTYIQFQFVLDDTDEPISGLQTRITLPDGMEKFFRTDSKGQIHIKDIDKGICDIKCDLKKPELNSTGAVVKTGPAARGSKATNAIKTIANIEAHKVKTGETIGGLAKDNDIAWQDLAHFNWDTSKPTEINKALAKYVGCTKKTKDGNNYVFNDADDPGIVYIPTPWSKESLSTGQEHIFRVETYTLEPRELLEPVMSISFAVADNSELNADYPKYRLKTDDGSYDKTLCPKDDLVPGDGFLQLQFKDLDEGGTYTLLVECDDGFVKEAFKDLPFEKIADTERGSQEIIADFKFLEINFEPEDSTPVDEGTE